jgi:hypothetical protein
MASFIAQRDRILAGVSRGSHCQPQRSCLPAPPQKWRGLLPRGCPEMSVGTGILLWVMVAPEVSAPHTSTESSPAPAPPAAGQARPFAHLNAPLHALYRQIMTVFRASKQRFIVHLRPEDVAEALRAASTPAATQEEVAEALSSLEAWGNLRATPDTGRVTTVEDFYRTRYLYQLSREGEAAERALEVYEQEIARRGELQAVALEDIRLRLRALAGLPEDPDPAVVHSLLLELSGRLDSLAANATAFMSSLSAPSTCRTSTRRHSSPTRTGCSPTWNGSSPSWWSSRRRSPRCCGPSTTTVLNNCWPWRPSGRPPT